MKIKKRAALLAAVMAFALMLPQAAMAADAEKYNVPVVNTTLVNPLAPVTYGVGGPNELPIDTDIKKEDEAPVVPEANEQGDWDGVWGVLTEHSLPGFISGVPLNTSNMEIYFYFHAKDGNNDQQAVPDMATCPELSVTLDPTGAFSAQDLKVETVGKHIVKISGLKYTNPNSTRFVGSITGKDIAGVPLTQMNIGENIPELKKPEEPGTTVGPDGEVVEGATSLIVKSSSIGADVINAGDAFTLNLNIYATASGKKAVNDVIVSVAPAEGVVITSGSSTQYVGTMKPGASTSVSFPMRVLPDYTQGVSSVNVSVTGVGADGTPTVVSIPVRQPDRFEITRVEAPDTMQVGMDNVASIYFVNKGKTSVNNLTVQLVGTNLNQSTQSQYYGNLNAGTEDSVDLDLSPVEAGTVEGTITVTYESAAGETITLTEKLSIPVEEYQDPWGGMDPGMMEPEYPMEDMEPEGGMAPWQMALIGVVAVGAVVILIVVLRKRAAKKKAAQEESDEDF